KSRLLAEAARRVRVPVLDCQAFASDRDEAWIARLFAGHVLKENDVLLPALLASQGTDVPALLAAVHRRAEQAAPVNPAEAAIAADPLGTVLSLLLQAAAALARAGHADPACRLAAAAWEALREPRPDLAVRVTAVLHG